MIIPYDIPSPTVLEKNPCTGGGEWALSILIEDVIFNRNVPRLEVPQHDAFPIDLIGKRIVRNDADLIKAKAQLSHWKKEVEEKIKSHNVNPELYELQNMITIGSLIVQQSIDRDENCGGLVKIN